MSRPKIHECVINGTLYKYIDVENVNIQIVVDSGRMFYKFFTPWKALWSEPLKVMEKVAFANKHTGEILTCVICELSQQGWGGNAYFIACRSVPSVRVDLKKHLQQLKE